MTFFSLVADFVGLDPRIAAWLIDPNEAAPSFEDLVAKYLGNSVTAGVRCAHGSAAAGVLVSRFGVCFTDTRAAPLFSTRSPLRSPPDSGGSVRASDLARPAQMLAPFTLSSRGRCGEGWGFLFLGEAVPEEFFSRPALQNGPGAATCLFLEWRAACF